MHALRAMAKKFAKSESTKSTISKIFKSAYGRPATQAEIELSQSFLDQWLNNQEPNKEAQTIETKADKSIDSLSLYENTPVFTKRKELNWDPVGQLKPLPASITFTPMPM